MKLLHLIDSLYRGGAQKVVIEIVKLFPQHRHYIAIFEDNRDLEVEIKELKNVSIIRLPFKNSFSVFRCILFVRKLVKQEKIDCIHSHMFIPHLIARNQKRNIKIVSTYHGEVFESKGIKSAIIRFLERIFFERSNTNIFVSEHVKKYVLHKLSKKEQGIVVYNFVESQASKKEYDLKNDETIKIVATSNNQPYKNYPLLLKAFQRTAIEKMHLYIYGSLMDELKEFVKANNLQSKITFMGVHKNIPQILTNYDIFIMTSDSGEGFSLAMLEAMSAGMAIICSDIPQFIEAVGEQNELTFKNKDVDDLGHILTISANCRDLLPVYGEKMFQRSLLFSKNRFLHDMENIYTL